MLIHSSALKVLGAWVAGAATTLAMAAPMEMHGTVYPGACEPKPWQALKAQFASLAGPKPGPSPEPLLRALLCGSTDADRTALLAAAPRRVPLVSEGTGEATERRRAAASEVLAPRDGQAWDATLTRSRGDLTLSYRTDEACVRSVTLRWQGTDWRFVRAGEACD